MISRILLFGSLLSLLLLSCEKEKDSSAPGVLINHSAPIVKAETDYSVFVIPDRVYGKGLVHDTWNSLVSVSKDLTLDVYQPDNSEVSRPAILLIHGGGFVNGNKSDPNLVRLAYFFASRGWVAFSINYRKFHDIGTVPDAWLNYVQSNPSSEPGGEFLSMYPAHRDAKAALRWIYAHASQYRVNTNYLTAAGGSAGAIISIMLAVSEPQDYTYEIPVIQDSTLNTTNLDQDTKIQTAIDFWGTGQSIEALNKVYQLNRYDSADAALLIVHGTADTTFNYSSALELQNKYQNTGAKHRLVPLAGYGHSPWNAQVMDQSLEEIAFDFIVETQSLNVVF